MTVRRQRGSVLDVSDWPVFDADALSASARSRFDAQRKAVTLYAHGESLDSIEDATQIDRRQIYRCLDRALSIHPDTRIWGWRALVPQTRMNPYRRLKPTDRLSPEPVGMAGAFSELLEAHPPLRHWLQQQIKRRQIRIKQVSSLGKLQTRLLGLKDLHRDFISHCRVQGNSSSQYPFNTDRLAVRSLSAAAKSLCVREFGRDARLAGADHTKGLPTETALAALEPLQIVEFDGHRLDLRLTIVVRDPQRYEQSFEIERLWLLAIIDVKTRVALGYHLSLNREYSRHDVIRTIENALSPHRRTTFTLPGLT